MKGCSRARNTTISCGTNGVEIGRAIRESVLAGIAGNEKVHAEAKPHAGSRPLQSPSLSWTPFRSHGLLVTINVANISPVQFFAKLNYTPTGQSSFSEATFY